MMFESVRYIDLKLPRSWNQCTTGQLELIAACILRHTLTQDRYHPFDWLAVKTELFFLLTGLEVIGQTDTATTAEPAAVSAASPAEEPADGDTISRAYLVRQQQGQSRGLWRRLWPFRRSKSEGDSHEPFTIYTWQVASFIDQHLKWIDDEKAPSLLIFPYKHLLPYLAWTKGWLPAPWGWRLPYPKLERRYHAPAELLQDFTWQQYRHLQDYMELYIRRQNALAADSRRQSSFTDEALLAARRHFLTVLFHCEGVPHRVQRISDVQWLVILWWWHGMNGTGGVMGYLMKKYPRVFKTSTHTPRRQRKPQPNPLDIYVSIVATMQSENHLTEDEVNHQTFHIVLEQLERLAQKSEEMEKINKKNKH